MIVVGLLLAVGVFAVIVIGGWVVDRLEPDECLRPVPPQHVSDETPNYRDRMAA